LQPVGDLVQDLAAVRLAHARPGSRVERGARRLDGALGVLAAGARHPRPRPLGRGVDRVDRLARLGGTELAVDVEAILLHGAPLGVFAEVVSRLPQPARRRQRAGRARLDPRSALGLAQRSMNLRTAASLLRSGQAGVLLSLPRLLPRYYRVCFLGTAA